MDTPSLPSDFDELADSGEEEQDYERIWTLLQRLDEKRAASYDVDDEWEQLADRLDLNGAATQTSDSDASASPAQQRRASDRDPRASEASAPARLQRWKQVMTVAALVLCVVGVGLLWWSQPATVSTAGGERTVVTLPDGSTAELNGTTTLEYPRGFSSLPFVEASVRRVQLEGEAFFSVVEGERPFRVETPNARVEVLGTAFNVQSRETDGTPATSVAVESGRVQVTPQSPSGSEAESVLLDESGETSRVVGTNAPTPPKTIALKYVQAWRDGGFAMSDASVPTILRELEYRFGTSLRLGVPVAETDTMSLYHAQDAQLEDVLRDICLIQDLTYRETSQGYELVQK